MKHDSVFIYEKDSVFIKIEPDTVFYEKYKIFYRDRLKIDTLMKTDSIVIDNSRTEIIEVNRLKWWQKTLMWIGIVMMVIVIFKIIKTFKIF